MSAENAFAADSAPAPWRRSRIVPLTPPLTRTRLLWAQVAVDRRLGRPDPEVGAVAERAVVAEHGPEHLLEPPLRQVKAKIEAVKAEDQRRLERRVGSVRHRRGRRGVQLVAGAEEKDRPAVDRGAAVEPQLVIPVRERDLVGREAEQEPRVAVAPGRRHRRAQRRNRRADEPAGLQQVDVDVDEALVRARASRASVDDAAHVTAVRRRRAAGEELDLVDELGVNDARARTGDGRAAGCACRRAGSLSSRDSSRARSETAAATRPTTRRAASGSPGTDPRTCPALFWISSPAQRDARDLVALPRGDRRRSRRRL